MTHLVPKPEVGNGNYSKQQSAPVREKTKVECVI